MITVHEYKAELKKVLTEFAFWWEEQGRLNRNIYPEKLNTFQWDDQFATWISMQIENKQNGN